MKKPFSTFKAGALALLLLASGGLNAQDKPHNVIPEPVKISTSKGQFSVKSSTTILIQQEEARTTAELLVARLNKATGWNFTVKKGPHQPNAISFSLHKNPVDELGKEGYNLEVDANGAKVTANQTGGLFYGMQSILQLLPTEIESNTAVKKDWTIPFVKITDYPRFAWRGIMFDVSRHFFTKDEVKRFIDVMARLKYNTFHWHLTDDNGWRIEIKSLPKLTEVGAWRVPRIGKFNQLDAPKDGEAATDGGFYTQEDIKEVIKYASDRNVTIVPEIDVPGHSMAAIAAYPELSCSKDPKTKVNPGSKFAEWYGNGKFKMLTDNTLNPSDEKVYEFLDKVFTEVAALFPNPYIHVGGDECYKGFWEADANCQALMQKENMKHVEELQGYFMKRVEKILKTKGKKLLGWDEILEGGIAPEATVMSWRGIEGGIEAAKLGHNVVMTPSPYVYIDFMQSDRTLEPPIYATLRLKKCYDFEPIPEGIDGKFILGGQANLWTEGIPTLAYAEYMTYPRCWALSEVYWSPKEKKNWEKFVTKMENHFDRADLAGINYARSAYDAAIKPSMKDGKLVVELEAEISNLTIHYSIDDTVPSKFSPVYKDPIQIPEGPITLRVNTYRNGKPIGRMITLSREELVKRSK